MNFLVIDPSITQAGLALFNDKGQILHTEMIKFNSKKFSQEQRMFQLFDAMSRVIKNHPGDFEIICEKQFVNIMSEIVGVVKCFAGREQDQRIKTTFFPPSKWKKMATGKGNVPEEDLRIFVESGFPSMIGKSEHEIDCAAMFYAVTKKMESPQK
jgi:Holliday junction resolvasome RuvABC endonuclease subunit